MHRNGHPGARASGEVPRNKCRESGIGRESYPGTMAPNSAKGAIESARWPDERRTRTASNRALQTEVYYKERCVESLVVLPGANSCKQTATACTREACARRGRHENMGDPERAGVPLSRRRDQYSGNLNKDESLPFAPDNDCILLTYIELYFSGNEVRLSFPRLSLLRSDIEQNASCVVRNTL
ncbi:hypothetical protein EVAR_19326_1 [Eumeta japonica]|uniref:Uncharacterized protein n=1 Tax=Eumeta variegata TaxID=151549 RepID=A0A4C1TRL4_EUMVA|nr:hypothetical protein EVAR_19326_1 [Eumeta japonica]